MKSESGPLKYRLARRKHWSFAGPDKGEMWEWEYVLQGWFEYRIHGLSYDDLLEVGGEWRTLDTVDLED